MRSQIVSTLEAHDLTVSWLAARAGLPKQNVHNWLVKKTKPADPAVWDKMLGVLPRQDLSRPKIPVGFPVLQMRFAGIVPAGDWGDPLESEEFVEVEAKLEHPQRFMTTLVGDSCYPAILQGDTAIWHSDPSPAYGGIVLAQRLSDHFVTVKELQYDAASNRPVLIPINPATHDVDDAGGWKVIARLVAVIREVDGVERQWYAPKGLRRRHFLSLEN